MFTVFFKRYYTRRNRQCLTTPKLNFNRINSRVSRRESEYPSCTSVKTLGGPAKYYEKSLNVRIRFTTSSKC